MTDDDLQSLAEHYANRRGGKVNACLGAGTQGTVYFIDLPSPTEATAVKFHLRRIACEREVAVYRRLKELEITDVSGHEVPQLLHQDDQCLAIEMTIVSPPFCLDFGGAYLDRPPDYSPEVWEDWRREKSELFEENWPAVESILAEFRLMGIFIADVNPGNIRF